MAAPRMRGSTCFSQASACRDPGCPAHAGIYLRDQPPGGLLQRLPRACGDLPGQEVFPVDAVVAAPRMRGSTLAQFRCLGIENGCPAHAGIYLHMIDLNAFGYRLPRACGDLPIRAFHSDSRRKAAPRMRGSTLGQPYLGLLVPGCPAHAGIYPCRRYRWWRTCRLPRACGDLPERLAASS